MPCRRRTDDTRRILLVITVECLFAIFNSWFSDIILSLIYCQKNLSAGDNCPAYLRQNYDLLVMFDLFNSISNIILHCLCGKRFRNELEQMLKSMSKFFKHLFHDLWCCYFQIDCNRYSTEPYVSYNATVTRHESSNSSTIVNHNQLYLKIHKSPRVTSRNCCDCRWYFNRKPLIPPEQYCPIESKESFKKNGTHHAVRYTSLTQRTDITRPSQTQSMRLYYPRQQQPQIPTSAAKKMQRSSHH